MRYFSEKKIRITLQEMDTIFEKLKIEIYVANQEKTIMKIKK